MANKFYSLMTLCVLLGGVAFAQGDKVKPVETFTVAFDNELKPKKAPKIIATADEWKGLWGAIQPKEKLHQIDFTKHLVLVLSQDFADPNVIEMSLYLEAKGELVVEYRVTERGFEASQRTKYHFYVIPRDGITAIGDYKLPK